MSHIDQLTGVRLPTCRTFCRHSSLLKSYSLFKKKTLRHNNLNCLTWIKRDENVVHFLDVLFSNEEKHPREMRREGARGLTTFSPGTLNVPNRIRLHRSTRNGSRGRDTAPSATFCRHIHPSEMLIPPSHRYSEKLVYSSPWSWKSWHASLKTHPTPRSG